MSWPKYQVGAYGIQYSTLSLLARYFSSNNTSNVIGGQDVIQQCPRQRKSQNQNQSPVVRWDVVEQIECEKDILITSWGEALYIVQYVKDWEAHFQLLSSDFNDRSAPKILSVVILTDCKALLLLRQKTVFFTLIATTPMLANAPIIWHFTYPSNLHQHLFRFHYGI